MGFSTAEYFNLRARRYHKSLKIFPYARVLDMIPHIHFIQNNFKPNEKIKILDAFGGTGFLTNYLKKIASEIVVADESDGMMKFITKESNIKTYVTKNDFDDVIETYGEGYFDLVITHGGLHHAVVFDKDDNIIQQESQLKQNKIVSRLSRLTKTDGLLILGDISKKSYPSFTDDRNESFDLENQKNIIGKNGLEYIKDALNENVLNQKSLLGFLDSLEKEHTKSVKYKIPHKYFDHYISRYSYFGHKCYYSNFTEIEKNVIDSIHIGRTTHIIPWIFDNDFNAGWFFKEKFSMFNETYYPSKTSDEIKMFIRLSKYLGTRISMNKVFVNWGVTYSFFKKK